MTGIASFDSTTPLPVYRPLSHPSPKINDLRSHDFGIPGLKTVTQTFSWDSEIIIVSGPTVEVKSDPSGTRLLDPFGIDLTSGCL